MLSNRYTIDKVLLRHVNQFEHHRLTCTSVGQNIISNLSIFSFKCMFCRSMFVLLSFFFWSLCCLFFFDTQILIIPLVSSNSSCPLFSSSNSSCPLFSSSNPSCPLFSLNCTYLNTLYFSVNRQNVKIYLSISSLVKLTRVKKNERLQHALILKKEIMFYCLTAQYVNTKGNFLSVYQGKRICCVAPEMDGTYFLNLFFD